MHWRFGLATCLAATAIAISPARACMPMPAEPRLPDESDAAYQMRTAEIERNRNAQWIRERQTDAMQRADRIFVARYTLWSPPYRPRMRGGRLVPIPLPRFPYEFPTWFKPVDWFRGPPSRGMLRVSTSNTSCGPMSIGDTTFGQPGNLYVFFAGKGPLSEKTLIDAIAVDRINDPALTEFVAKYRKRQ